MKKLLSSAGVIALMAGSTVLAAGTASAAPEPNTIYGKAISSADGWIVPTPGAPALAKNSPGIQVGKFDSSASQLNSASLSTYQKSISSTRSLLDGLFSTKQADKIISDNKKVISVAATRYGSFNQVVKGKYVPSEIKSLLDRAVDACDKKKTESQEFCSDARKTRDELTISLGLDEQKNVKYDDRIVASYNAELAKDGADSRAGIGEGAANLSGAEGSSGDGLPSFVADSGFSYESFATAWLKELRVARLHDSALRDAVRDAGKEALPDDKKDKPQSFEDNVSSLVKLFDTASKVKANDKLSPEDEREVKKAVALASKVQQVADLTASTLADDYGRAVSKVAQNPKGLNETVQRIKDVAAGQPSFWTSKDAQDVQVPYDATFGLKKF